MSKKDLEDLVKADLALSQLVSNNLADQDSAIYIVALGVLDNASCRVKVELN